MATSSPTEEITLESFHAHRESVKVRRVQEKYEELAEAAKDGDIEAKMREAGYKDTDDFLAKCEQYPLTCSPGELEELGSGCVLYFYFVRSLVLLLFALFLIHIPALIVYSRKDLAWQWQFLSWNRWQEHVWQDHPEWQEYLDSAIAQQIRNGTTMAKMEAWDWSPWVALSPGGLGPHGGDSTGVLGLYVLSVCVLGFAVVAMAQHQDLLHEKVDEGSTVPNDFAILVRDLPASAVDESCIQKFFEDHAIPGRTGVPIVKVIVAWSFEEFRAKTTALQALAKRHETLDPGSAEAQQVKQEILEIQKGLNAVADSNKGGDRLKSTGMAVVVFRYQTDLRACLEHWDTWWARQFYRDSKIIGEQLGLSWRTDVLPLFPIGNGMPTYRIRVERAANPGDIHWEELGVDKQEVRKQFLFTNCTMAVVIAFVFFAIWGIDKLILQIQASSEGGAGIQFLVIAMGLMVSAGNVMMGAVAKLLGAKEIHETWTSQEFSQSLKMGIGKVLCNAGSVAWVNATPERWYGDNGLVNKAVFLFLLLFFVGPLVALVDFKYCLACRKRRNLDNEMMARWNAVLEQGPPEKPKVQTEVEAFQKRLAEYRSVLREVRGFKTAFEPGELSISRQYIKALTTAVCCIVYMPYFPCICLVGVVSLVLQYSVDKYVLLRKRSRPERPVNESIAIFSVTFIRVCCPLLLAIFYWYALLPSWKQKREVNAVFIPALLVALSLAVIPVSVSKTLLGVRILFWRKGTKVAHLDEALNDYYRAQYMWSKSMKYHHDHFLYKRLPERLNPEFLKSDEDHTTNLADVKTSFGAAGAAQADETVDDDVKHKGFRTRKGHVPNGRRRRRGKGGGKGGKSRDSGHQVVPDAAVDVKTFGAPDAAADVKTFGAAGADPGADSDAGGAPPLPPPPSTLQVIWEFNHGEGKWSKFAATDQDEVERRFQEWQHRGGAARMFVETQKGGSTVKVSVDFARLTQMVMPHGKVRSIRRLER